MNKWIMVVCIIAVLALIAGLVIELNKPDKCLISDDIAQKYMIECQSIQIEGSPYTICKQNLEMEVK